jgi:gamma-glutamyl:cysteine ligase YbdK (ATP-grasp superfamily)
MRSPAPPQRRQVGIAASSKNLAIGSVGRDASVCDLGGPANRRRARYRDLISALRFVARQELIFGMHVHVGVDDPDKAIHVANGMRVHMPVLLGLSANSPFWRADATGLASTRTLARRLIDRMREHCEDLGSAAELEAVEDLLDRGNGASRQVVVYEANHDLREVMAEIVSATAV